MNYPTGENFPPSVSRCLWDVYPNPLELSTTFTRLSTGSNPVGLYRSGGQVLNRIHRTNTPSKRTFASIWGTCACEMGSMGQLLGVWVYFSHQEAIFNR